MRIRSVGLVGAGTMGSAIAALLASAGFPVTLLDIPGETERNGPAKNGLDRALKSKPPAFMDAACARRIQIGNIDDDLGRLVQCDWVIEAVVEQAEPKRALFARLDGLLRPETVVTTNTSSIPMASLVEGRSEAFRKRFFGTHFFNPPRYLHILEIITTPDVDPDALAAIESVADHILGKGTVRAKDVPGFIANRLGVYGMTQTIRLMDQYGLTIDEVDALTGPLIGRPRSATFRTCDITGIDVFTTVAAQLGATTGADFGVPAWVQSLVDHGALGEKSGVGFYRREGRQILTLNPQTGEYVPKVDLEVPEVAALARRPLPERLRGIGSLPGKYGQFMRALFMRTAHFTLEHTPQIAWDIPSVDHAMEWGFGWEIGPFRQMDAVGLDAVRHGLADLGLPEPQLLHAAEDRFYRQHDARQMVLTVDGARVPLEERPGVVSVQHLKEHGRTLRTSDDASLMDLGDGVVLLEFHSRMNTLGEGTIQMLHEGLDIVEQGAYAGLVIGNDDPRVFSAGANLLPVLTLAQSGRWDELDAMVSAFQQATMRVRRAPVPVVVAPFGMTLGGGAEFVLHADQVQAWAELAIGLVEFGVGLIPAGGGTKELMLRFTTDLQPYLEADPFEAARRAFTMITLAQTSGSALEARRMGFLRPQDRITMNRDRLIADAKNAVLSLAPDYVPPAPASIRLLGRDTLGNLRYAVWAFVEAGQASEHDALIAEKLAWILSGGDGMPRYVSEQDMLDFEREAFLSLLGTQKTQERIAHTLQTGKPLRN